jgi:hypothetical protein
MKKEDRRKDCKHVGCGMGCGMQNNKKQAQKSGMWPDVILISMISINNQTVMNIVKNN